jgi:hypothetical protein
MVNNSTNINKANNHLKQVVVNNSTNINIAKNHLKQVVELLTITCLGDVRFVNIGGIVERHLFKVMFALLILVELLTITCLR